MAPRYQQPAAPGAGGYEHTEVATAAAPVAAAAGDIGWKEFFPDPELQDLLARALANNRDLRIATLNVEAARAQYRIQRADARAGHRRAGFVDQRARAGEPVANRARASSRARTRPGFGVSAFELDLFGRVRSLRRAALEDYFRLEETRTAAQLVLVSEVANAWLTLIADRAAAARWRGKRTTASASPTT